jgi:hypothetical protein
MRLIDADAFIADAKMVGLNTAEKVLFALSHQPTIEPKTRVIAQVTFDEDKLREIVNETVERIKEEYDIVDNPDAVSEWIPCSERLPESGVSVIVTSKGGYVYTSNIAHGEWKYGGDIIAWMPLPTAYKGGADDE